MPNIWTHIFFAEDVCNALSCESHHSDYRYTLFLGAQGPDPFFYYRFWPWLSNNTGKDIGNALHTKQCGPFLMHLIESAGKQSDETKVYVMGFITHHLLDRHTHPYIHYRAGYQGSKHQKLETIIDTIWAFRTRKMELWKHPAYAEINVGNPLPASILYLLDDSIRKFYPALSFQMQDIQTAYQDMITAQKLFADPDGWKNKILKPFISSYSHQPVNTSIDYLNEAKKPWMHAATGEVRQESFAELYEDAFHDAVSLLPLVADYWKEGGTSVYEQLSRRIGNISYDTGTPLANQDSNRFSVPIV
ncbi:zinc dependent phospholipase C family protein [Oceanobacillus locisalsi]|uniref:Zinc dependent phospholipase C family protein n=1 Tax=Oceanobacillus locisalsi TaxID=546107 RepID=A0ABW3NDT3_9BACI